MSKLTMTSGMSAMASASSKYAWAPQGLQGKETDEFFSQLPRACVPEKGTEGEEWRRQQLLTQQPPYDTNYMDCDQLTAQEVEWFKKFDKSRMREAFDVGLQNLGRQRHAVARFV